MMRSRILDGVARVILPVLALFTLYLLLRGHNEPGGGFIAGLVSSAGLILYSLAFGEAIPAPARSELPRHAASLGLVIAATTGLAGAVLGDGFLTHYHAKISVPGFRTLHLSTTLLFDMGVYLVVVGATATLLSTFASGIEP